ncbi:MAG TPA: CRISPR-associated endonuclease Cas3'' [Streptosporangiaceae bacterium]|nr:CRISPR-associated endonuclease Cas3'' [Streptosporangiaceae bacterium]
MSSGGAGQSGFADFFVAATGRQPGDLLLRLAEQGLTEYGAVPAPQGRGAETVLVWVWRRLHGSEVVAAATARRLVYVLPQGSLVEPVAMRTIRWLTRVGLSDRVALHTVPGGPESGGPRWRQDPHCPAIVIGCADYLVSKALNHGYGIGPAMYPIDFALVTNGAQWVFDDITQCGRSASMVAGLASAAARWGTGEPFAVTFQSPTVLSARTLDVEPGDYRAIAAALAEIHQPGTRTLVAANSVASAIELYSALADSVVPEARKAGLVPRVLIHSQFRGRERLALAEAVTHDPGRSGQIVVATRAAQAGIDAACVIAEPAAPPTVPASTVLASTGPGSTGPGSTGPGSMGEPSMTNLFDSAVPVGDFLDHPDELEAQLIWATWTDPGQPPQDASLPADQWRCRAPLALIDALSERAPVWRMNHGGWTALNPEQPARPGEILLVAASDGGYDPVLGFDPAIRAAVGDSPSADPIPAPNHGGRWVSLRQHSEETRDQAAALLAEAAPELPDAAGRAVVCAAYLHDLGKAHPIWQDALCAVAADDDRERIEAGRPWAKSGLEAPLVFAGDVSFRHELASLLLIDGPLRGLIDGAADHDLVRFLVLAHHGRLRLSVRGDESAGPAVIHGLEHGATWPIPSVLDQPAVALTVDLGQFGENTAWTAAVLGLLDRYGPFTLAYLETLVRIADWRSSGGEPMAARVQRGSTDQG